mmetsp:Transcript_106151/g.300169  ORF Transcript_106151/g.300169 Transcript_106151/m.300169 type:complete len:213 (-) Transcript_106151:479-1117(-)
MPVLPNALLGNDRGGGLTDAFGHRCSSRPHAPWRHTRVCEDRRMTFGFLEGLPAPLRPSALQQPRGMLGGPLRPGERRQILPKPGALGLVAHLPRRVRQPPPARLLQRVLRQRPEGRCARAHVGQQALDLHAKTPACSAAALPAGALARKLRIRHPGVDAVDAERGRSPVARVKLGRDHGGAELAELVGVLARPNTVTPQVVQEFASPDLGR